MIPASLSAQAMPSWPWTRGRYPITGAPGLSAHAKNTLLLYRGRTGRLLGVLHICPARARGGLPGFSIQVSPAYRRKGVATKLLTRALELCPRLDLAGERYTTAGAAFVNAFLAHWEETIPCTPSKS